MGVTSSPPKCPACGGNVSDFILDPGNIFVIFGLDDGTQLRAFECPYCTAGMLLCVRGGRLMGIEPFKDDPPADDIFQAVARTRAKLGM